MNRIHTFNATYRQAVDRVMNEMGLTLISTHKQIENGTLMYRDPIGDCLYALYESGYIRRFVPTRFYGSAYHRKGVDYKMYQLNPTCKEKRLYKRSDGLYAEMTSIRRVLLNPMEQLGKITIGITNYRNQ